MSTEHTRRDFLRFSATGLAASAAAEALPAWGSPNESFVFNLARFPAARDNTHDSDYPEASAIKEL